MSRCDSEGKVRGMKALAGALICGFSVAVFASPVPIPTQAISSRALHVQLLDPFLGAEQFPQFRDVSGLPGDGFGLLVDGTPSINGAMALATPIAFSLGNGIFNIGGSTRSFDSAPQFPNLSSSDPNPSSSKLQGMAGVHTPIGNLSGTFEVLSAELDQVYNFELQLPLNWDKGGVAFGVQNLTGRHEAAAAFSPGENAQSRSYFAVSTYEFLPNDYVSLGYGDVRFRGPFGNVSVLAAPRLKVTTEYDTFSFNTGVAYSFGGIRNLQNTDFTLWVGYLEERYASIVFNFSF